MKMLSSLSSIVGMFFVTWGELYFVSHEWFWVKASGNGKDVAWVAFAITNLVTAMIYFLVII